MTIRAGSASADVTVLAAGTSGGLPLGTVLWSNPTQADEIVPAVPEELVAAADRALYRAKAKGRGRVEAAVEGDGPPAS